MTHAEIRSEISDLIVGSLERIEIEYATTPNDWLSCFGSRVFAIECIVSLRDAVQALESPGYEVVVDRLECLKEELAKAKDEYPDREPLPPQELRRKLLGSLGGLLAP